MSNESPETSHPKAGLSSEAGSPTSESNKSMQEFYQLQKTLLIVTIAATGIIFIIVWIVYSLNIALNYLLGACTGVVYLRMLAKDVEQLGREKERLSKNRLALFIGLIIVASRWHQLQILPVFLGFLTYKVTLLIYMFQSIMPTKPQVE